MNVKRRYTTDTTTFINGWYKWYPPDVFPDFWVWIRELFSEGRLYAIDTVREELERYDDEILRWCKENKIPFSPVDDQIELRAIHIREKYPKLLKKGRQVTEADNYIIAHAIVNNLTVITEEQSRRGKIPIPDVCNKENIVCINLLKLLRLEQVQFIRHIS